jgi:hypothetical protein
MLLIVAAIPVVVVYRTLKNEPKKSSTGAWRNVLSRPTAYLVLLCVAASVGSCGVSEFEDHQGRKLPIFHDSLVLANQSAAAKALLGGPIRASWPVKRTGDLSDDAPEVHLIIPVSGETHPGKLAVDAVRADQSWKIKQLSLVSTDTNPPTAVDITPKP